MERICAPNTGLGESEMPGEPVPLIYLDSCVLLSYIDGDEDRAPIIEELFRRSRAREVDLIPSIASRVEVAFDSAEKAGSALDPEVEKRIDTLWIRSTRSSYTTRSPAKLAR